MNITALIDAFERLIGVNDEVEPEVLVDWMNEAQEIIALEYGPMVVLDIGPLTAGALYTLPNNFLRIERLFKDGVEYNQPLEVRRGGYLIVPETGSWLMDYTRLPVELTTANMNAEPEVHKIFHRLIPVYCAYLYYSRQSEGDPDESSFADGYLNKFTVRLMERVSALVDRWDGRQQGSMETKDVLGWKNKARG